MPLKDVINADNDSVIKEEKGNEDGVHLRRHNSYISRLKYPGLDKVCHAFLTIYLLLLMYFLYLAWVK